MRRFVIPVIWSGVVVMSVAGCRPASDPPPSRALEMSCDNPSATSLGVPTVRRPARFTTSGGRMRFVVTGLPSGSIFGEIEDTEVQLSDPDAPTDVRVRVTASPEQPGVVDVDAGTYSVLNVDRGGSDVEVCSGVTLSDVEPATPIPGTGTRS